MREILWIEIVVLEIEDVGDLAGKLLLDSVAVQVILLRRCGLGTC